MFEQAVCLSFVTVLISKRSCFRYSKKKFKSLNLLTLIMLKDFNTLELCLFEYGPCFFSWQDRYNSRLKLSRIFHLKIFKTTFFFPKFQPKLVLCSCWASCAHLEFRVQFVVYKTAFYLFHRITFIIHINSNTSANHSVVENQKIIGFCFFRKPILVYYSKYAV